MPNLIKQIRRLRNAVRRWKARSLMRRVAPCYFRPDDYEPTGSSTPPGRVSVYVGRERRRFVIPTRFLNLPVFVTLLDQAEEEFGFLTAGVLALPCDAGFLRQVLRLLDEDESRFGRFDLEKFVQVISQIGSSQWNCKVSRNAVAPLPEMKV